MKWAYSIQQKFKAAILLAVVCVIILITTLLGKYHMNELSDSFSSVYKDRLVVESYIFMISDHLYQKKLAFDNCSERTDSDFRSKTVSHNEAIKGLLLFYEKTYLTEKEAAFLKDFKANIAALQDLELQYLQSPADEAQHTRTLFNEHFALASANLHRLSQIQVEEGKTLNDQSQRIFYGSSLLTSFAMVMLVCIAIILQVIVLASRPAINRTWQQSNLN
jgi:hypothetical protein